MSEFEPEPTPVDPNEDTKKIQTSEFEPLPEVRLPDPDLTPLVFTHNNRVIFRITKEMKMEFHPDVTPKEAARLLAEHWNEFVDEAVRKERERCAKIAEGYVGCDQIAAKIREGK